MGRYDIAVGRIPITSGDAVVRAQKMLVTPMGKLPKNAVSYAKHLCDEYGACGNGELILTAYAHYAQEMEGMTTNDVKYKSNPEAREFFKNYRGN